MAVGLARMMNLSIPVNFNSPLKAASFTNFWQRWHISLTNAITACVYTPLVRSLGDVTLGRTACAAFVTFFLAGIWHGAGWTFVAMGLLCGFGIAVNQIWKRCRLPMPKLAAHGLTLLYVLVIMIFFRAPSVPDALHVLHAMIGGHGVSWPQAVVEAAQWYFSLPLPQGEPLPYVPRIMFPAALLVVAFCPNSNEIIRRVTPGVGWALVFALAFLISLLHFEQPSSFLYFNF